MPQPIDRTLPTSPRDARRPQRELAEEQAALRRVATLIAGRAEPASVFAAVAQEVAGVLCVPLPSIVRTTQEGIATQVGAFGEQNPFPVGTSWPLDDFGASGRVWHSQAPARVDYTSVPGDIAARLVRHGRIRFAVGVPIFVDGAVWGAMMALSAADVPLPQDTEQRLAAFTELVGTAISNTQFADDLRELAREQAALKRVATLVARDADAQAVFDAVCTENRRADERHRSQPRTFHAGRVQPNDGGLEHTRVSRADRHPASTGGRYDQRNRPADGPTGPRCRI
jgi:GAF domain-containing protein